MGIWFTSDHHFGHRNIIKYCNRPFQNLDEMRETCIYLWNRSIKRTDTVFYVGDFSLSTRVVKEITPQLNGNKILLWGNHDRVHPARAKQEHVKWCDFYKEAGWTDVGEELWFDWKGKNLRVTHLPYAGENDVKWLEYRPMPGKEDILICGHVHEKWKRMVRKGKLMLNVGVDQWGFEPVNLAQLEGEFNC